MAIAPVSENNTMAMWPEWKIKVVFMSICVPECLLHPSAVSNKPGYFQAWVCFFIEEQTPECERNVLSKQRQRPQLCLKWDSGPEESFHMCRRKKSVDNSVSVSARERACPLPSPPQLPGHSVGWFFRCWHTHTETFKSKQLCEDFLILCCRIETLNVLQSSLRVCLHGLKRSYTILCE